MKLYLSSYKFGGYLHELSKLVGENKRALVVMNAVDWGDPARAATSLAEQVAGLKSVGINAEALDLRAYFGKTEKLRQLLDGINLVWVCGGNSFVLKRAFEQSGFDTILKEKVADESFVYGGYSAGVVVITPTLKGVNIVDDPSIVPSGYKREYSEDGLGLVNYVVAMHYDSNHPETKAVSLYVDFCTQQRIPYKKLRDGEVILVSGNTETILPIKRAT
jgi:dipeptidase E